MKILLLVALFLAMPISTAIVLIYVKNSSEIDEYLDDDDIFFDFENYEFSKKTTYETDWNKRNRAETKTGLQIPPEVISSYNILGIEVGANIDKTKVAYRKLVRIFHPDVHKNEENKKYAEGKIKQYTKALIRLLQSTCKIKRYDQ